jgi:urease gamma subunit
MRAIFREHLKTDVAQEDMRRGIEIAKKTRSCLLCFEHAPGARHRMVVADVMAEKTGMEIVHLDPVFDNSIPSIVKKV